MQNWKEYLKMVLGALLPVTYYLILDKNPDIPISEEMFIELIMWLVGAALGGWGGLGLWKNHKLKKKA